MRAPLPPGVPLRAAVITCAFLAFRASWWAAVDPAHAHVLPVILWMLAALALTALLPTVDRAGGSE
ncbi:hypothetical protein [Deinococcus aquiradiocola]|uniref:Uncharacterized protein n=1 Tax=Deinococcus aquiradiocola TaxID=393059 RepID=A0A917P776_9DEIO|nr:hypothetical protein [Deinococcus aquiradiocola]GGJ65136.1 hypothetical protein GCM10008939_06280 [Deinococcus aquiradiocola]